VLRAGYGLVTLVTVTTALGIASYAAYWAAARAAFPAMRLSVSRFSPRQVREVTAFSVYLFLISIAIHVSLNADNLVIGAYLGTSAVAVYTVAMRLADYQRQLCDQFSGFLFPLAVRFDASGDSSALRATLLDGTRIALGLVGGVTLCLIAFGRQLIAAWMGPGFAESVAPLYVLALAGIVMVGQGPAGTILLTTGRQRLVAIISIVDITINVVLSIVLVSRYGLTGVAIGTALPYVVLNVLVLVPIACRTVGVSVREFARSVVTPTAVALLPAAAAATLFRTASTPASFAAIIAQGAAVALVYFAAFCVLGLGSVDRERYAGFVRRSALALRRPGVAIS
jgi:O-antigen/teichoic acid export membrane protein